MFVTASFVLPGSISFDYKVYSFDTGAFQLLVDGVVAVSTVPGENIFSWQHVTIPVSPGAHNFRWSFQNGLRFNPTLLQFQGVTIASILHIVLLWCLGDNEFDLPRYIDAGKFLPCR